MKKILFLAIVLLFLAGCDGDRGDQGVDGITGIGGCDSDQVRDEDTGLCVANLNMVHEWQDRIEAHKKEGHDGECTAPQVEDDFGHCVDAPNP